ncbi:SDR family oxidoreductase [Rhodococcus cercidiphylli]|uniref:SDR family oxidoreductase n=1 Tax=Rhodococcus cercidiphylli TaxID=489916 RepID=A0ABU4AWK8_9NOCA|nr:SDR family oxidoreductase [Rhodococcus cercidiphylli]MDV6230624.1 SDR family oxidoreductase [Rhodococcus cercidiphylli]
MTDTKTFSPHLLDGKRVLITGGGTGLGRGVARHLVNHGAEVHLWGRRDSVLAEAAEEASSSRPGSVFYHSVDVRDYESVDSTMERIWQDHGPLTSVVNNAAANFIAQTKDLSPRAFQAVTSTVMNGSFHTTHAAGKRWIAEGLPGNVLSTLTTWVWTGSAYVVPSAMAKAAVHSMTMSLAVEWAKYGIRLNALAPGPIPTDYAWEMLNPTDKSAVGATQADQIPAGRTGTIEELANLTMFVISDACEYLTGQTIAMDGGQMLAGPGTFAGLTSLTDDDWSQIRESSKTATASSKAQRTT